MNTNINSVSEKVHSDKNAVELEEALSIAGFGWYNLKYCFVLLIFIIAVIVDSFSYSYVLPAAKCDLQMSDEIRGFIASIPYIGLIISSFPWGYLVDTRGRKPVLIYSTIATGLFSVLSAFMPEVISFIVIKFITSICVGCAAAAPYTYLGEIIPLEFRDLTISVITSLQILSSAIVPLIAWAILPLDFRVDFGIYYFRSWRLLTIIYSCFFLLSAFLLSFGPESPKFLVSQGKHDEALEVLQTIYVKNKGKTLEEYPVKKLIMPEERENLNFLESLKVQSVPLFKPPYFKWLALNGFLLFGIFTTIGFVVWGPDILNQVLAHDARGVTTCVVLDHIQDEVENELIECDDSIDEATYTINTIISVACFIVAFIGSITIKWIGKKNLLIVLSLVVGLLTISIDFITIDYSTASLVLYSSALLCYPTMAVSIGPINAYSIEIFPTHLRGMAVSLTMMLGSVGCIIGINGVGLMLNAICPVTFYSFGGLVLFCAFLSFLLPNSKKLQELQKYNNIT